MAFKYYFVYCPYDLDKTRQTFKNLSDAKNYRYSLIYGHCPHSCKKCDSPAERGGEISIIWECNCDNYMTHAIGDTCYNCKSKEPSLSSGSGGGCFLTTIVCQELGFEDNCHTLENLRKFRSEVLEKTDEGKKLLLEYRDISERIIPNIISDSEKKDICLYVYNEYILPINTLVDANDHKSAIEKYKCMVNFFISKYKV